ncbi:MAG TPA: site-specific DNA-methyltransferase [Terriglobia bacterium]|nr:site-specific DNA-methyltransferase [Terriglobia bacterium]
MEKRQKLELTWIGKEDRPRLEPRVLLEDPAQSYHAATRVTDHDIFDNRLIFGDNLLALKALEPEFAGQVKCIYIDPPYNTGNAFENYDDSVEHSVWLGLMRDRLEVLRNLLRPNGFICCHIDDSEGQYLKVLMDEVFGRANYLTTFYIQVRYPEKTLKQDMAFHKEIEQIHIYRRDYGAVPNLNAADASYEKFRYYIREKHGGRPLELGGKDVTLFRPDEYEITEGEGTENGLKEIWATGTILDGNSSGRFFRDYLAGRSTIDGLGALYKVTGIGDDKFGFRYFTGPRRAGATKGKYFQGVPLNQLENPDVQSLSPIENFYDLAGSFGNCRHEGGVEFRSGKKPEKLLEIIIRHFSSPGDWILDSFAGSGTTGAVAHKMRRKWVMVELREHCDSHIVPRMTSIINGTDLTGVTETVGWKGGGGFRYYRIAPSLLEKDRFGNWVISKQFNAAMLAEAMCKLEGFTYAPSETEYWMHGHSTERDFIYVTTQTLTREQLQKLSEDVGESRSLLVCCSAFRARDLSQFPNLTVKKIPKMVLNRCEWGKDDYSLEIENLPAPPPETFVEPAASAKPRNGRKSSSNGSLDLSEAVAETEGGGK